MITVIQIFIKVIILSIILVIGTRDIYVFLPNALKFREITHTSMSIKFLSTFIESLFVADTRMYSSN